jgi:hypothetical protein
MLDVGVAVVVLQNEPQGFDARVCAKWSRVYPWISRFFVVGGQCYLLVPGSPLRGACAIVVSCPLLLPARLRTRCRRTSEEDEKPTLSVHLGGDGCLELFEQSCVQAQELV